MGEITNIEFDHKNNDAMVTIKFPMEHLHHLKGNSKDMQVFSEKSFKTQVKIARRGKNAAAMYLRIPKQYRKNIPNDAHIKMTRMDVGDKAYFIFAVDKK